ncbi:MAG: type II toxin-antitoxin system RelE/ParE family toxin [Gammaproteobacteria bacterium]|nr:MAG: type II toxin-antitoxin system RelE/ParE family toxin [Gammaproteobacteria bacterium]
MLVFLDKPQTSITFAKSLEQAILDIPNQPFKYRKSIYFDNINIRDMIFKKWTIVYEVKQNENIVEVLQIFNQNKPAIK